MADGSENELFFWIYTESFLKSTADTFWTNLGGFMQSINSSSVSFTLFDPAELNMFRATRATRKIFCFYNTFYRTIIWDFLINLLLHYVIRFDIKLTGDAPKPF